MMWSAHTVQYRQWPKSLRPEVGGPHQTGPEDILEEPPYHQSEGLGIVLEILDIVHQCMTALATCLTTVAP